MPFKGDLKNYHIRTIYSQQRVIPTLDSVAQSRLLTHR
jgi:hypothetical protein